MLMDDLNKHVIRSQRIYLFCAILVFPKALSTLIEGISEETTQAIFQVFLYSTTYYGLRRKKAWVIPLVLLPAAFSIFLMGVAILNPAENLQALLVKIASVAFVWFLIYQLWLFSKREVQLLFGFKGKVIF